MAMTKGKKARKRSTRPRAARYATEVQLHRGVWDMGITFGNYRPNEGANGWQLVNEAPIVMPMGLVKMLVYGLTAHLISHEAMHGTVVVPAKMIPPSPPVELTGPDGAARMAILRAELFPTDVARPVIDKLAIDTMTKGTGNKTH